jgi:hypothetical protein
VSVVRMLYAGKMAARCRNRAATGRLTWAQAKGRKLKWLPPTGLPPQISRTAADVQIPAHTAVCALTAFNSRRRRARRDADPVKN